ncbi:MAG: DUF4982 domain-containing protein [Bacteroidales bacterium]|nr:DUF4982 domain-containing protein [Bacteroidales bacterium]MCM1416881.1 DUF4982 domain-containing protein [bacterium]MCM1424765.1 DUF4982 domain-containing protein [bacterium]
MNEKMLWNGGWSFLKTEPGTMYEQATGRAQEFQAVDIPHDWLIYDTLNLYEDSTGWYRKRFTYEQDSRRKAFLTFEGIYMDSTVYINGVKAGEWKYGYSSFTLDITAFLRAGENEIMVGVCFLSPNSRWYSGAGIYRNVWFQTTEATYLPQNAVYISSRQQSEDCYLIRIETEIAGERKGAAQLAHALYDTDGKEVALEPADRAAYGDAPEKNAAVSAKENTVVVRYYRVNGIRRWDIDAPVLYTLQTTLSAEKETLHTDVQRIGFRHVEYTTDKGLFLNGRHIKLNGVCEHHDLGALGAAFNRSAMRRKFRILKEMGVNAVRGAHNMMAPEALALADEMGVLIISEAFDMWERPKTEYDYARFFKDWSAKDVASWIRGERNHPSILFWSIGNEIYDTHADAHGMELTKYLRDEAEKHDPMKNARVTFGSNYMPWENTQKCAELIKMPGYNYAEKYYEEHHRAHPDWVIYGSETSSIVQSRGVYHFPLKEGILAEEDEQCSALGNSSTSWSAKSMEICATVDRDMEFSLGQFIWSGFDYIGEPTPYHTKNSYFGQIDTAGFPKDSFYVYQSVWTDYRKKPMVHIFPYWDFNEGQLIDVRVCSNAPDVELFVNGRSLGRQHLTHEAGSGSHIIADYQVPYEKGVLMAVAYDYSGNEIAREEKHSFGNSERIVIEPDETRVRADGRDLLFLTIGTVDGQGNPVENACDRISVKVSGKGRLIGLDNGDSTDFDSYKGVSRRLFNGKLLAIVQADTTPGEITVEASGKNLESASVVCESYAQECREVQSVCENEWQTGGEIVTSAANREVPIVLGRAEEIPVRKIVLRSLNGQLFTKDNDTITVEAHVEPPQADDKELTFRAVNNTGVPVNLVSLACEGNRAVMKAVGDGNFRLFAMSKSGTGKTRVMSQLEFAIEGFGPAYMDPYGFVAGSQYTSVAKGDVGCGNERGVATGRDGDTIVCFDNLDFGNVGSDEITIPIFALDDNEYPIQIWEGVPGEEGSEMIADVVYQKPSIWNVYQEDTFKLSRRLKGITCISFHVRQKIHIKGFSFRKYEKAWMELCAGEADGIYGDSFVRNGGRVEGIGNNVTLEFTEMDFGTRDIKGIAIKGKAHNGSNTIHIRFYNGMEESKQIVEFPESAEDVLQEFDLEPLCGSWTVSFVFLPGSHFDFDSFRFL